MKNTDKVAIVIPARYASTRFPGKMLAQLGGKPMIWHTYSQAKQAKADLVLVAADDPRIIDAIESLGGQAVATSPNHPSGTDRIAEAVATFDCDIIINVQGDEPLIPTKVIDQLIELMKQNSNIEMATVAVPGSREDLADPNKVKVVFAENNMALYFSRSTIPFLREGGEEAGVYLHWGIYAYRRRTLERCVALKPGRLENCEKLEQLRALENGIGIYVLESDLVSIGVDTPEDLAAAEQKLKELRK